MSKTAINGAQAGPPNEELVKRLKGDAEHLRHQARQILERGRAESRRLEGLADYYEALAARESVDPTRLPAPLPAPPAPSGHLSGPAAGDLPIGAAAAAAAAAPEGADGATWR